MTYNAAKLILTLPKGNRLSDDLNSLVWDVKPPTFINDQGLLVISAEDGHSFVNFYGEFRGGYAWICPRLVAWAFHRSLRWEWVNPGTIVLVEA